MASAHTEKCWPDETPEQLIEAARERGGDKEAALVAKALGLPIPARKKPVPASVGNKPRHAPAPSGIPSQRERIGFFDPLMERDPGLGWSGAPRPHKARPRVASERKPK